MEDLYNSVYSTHKGISFSTIILFGAFIFLLIQTHLSHGRITTVFRKTAYFATGLIFVQAILAVFMGIYSPELANVSGFDSFLKHFRYALLILAVGGMMTYVCLFIKKNEKLELKAVVIALVSALVFEYAYPWKELLGF